MTKKKPLKNKKWPYDQKIFSGDYSVEMWNEINSARSKKELRWALFEVCVKLQHLESKYDEIVRELRVK